jgi:hypothetical protein
MRTRRAPWAVFLAAAMLVVAAVAPGALAAASPSPGASSPASEQPPDRPPFEVWLDRPLPADASPGDEVDVGATIWDRLGGEIPRMGATIVLRIVSADGAVPPSQTFARTDWPGHYRGTVEVPPGGIGRLELGVTGAICENDVCRPDDWVFDMGGVGPPPDAPIAALAEARITLDEDLVAGKPAGVAVVLTPQADWESFPAPAAIVVRAREPRGPNLATASLPLTDPAGFRYQGELTIPRGGDMVLEAASDEEGGDATRFGTSMIPVVVTAESGGDAADADAPPGAAGDDAPPPIVLALLALAMVVGGGVILSGFRRPRD